MNLALIPQNREKADIVALAADFLPFLNRCQLMATGTTGGRLTSKLGLMWNACSAARWATIC